MLWFAFSQTIVVPFMYNIWTTNVVNLRNNYGLPKAFKELHLLVKTLFTHFGFELVKTDRTKFIFEFKIVEAYYTDLKYSDEYDSRNL